MVNDEACGYFGRMLSLVIVSAAIILGIVGASNCHFLKYDNNSAQPFSGLEAPFRGTFEGHVGVFSYDVMRAVNDTSLTSTCVGYRSTIGHSNYAVITAAQFCAVFAPLIGFFGLMVSFVDTCLCRFCCSFLISSALYLAACGVQAGVFSLYAEPDFCFNGGQYCNVGMSVYLCGISSVFYFSACLFLCCFPSPEPYCNRSEPKSKPVRPPTKVVVQPVVMNGEGAWDHNEEEDEDGDEQGDSEKGSDEEEPAAPPSKKASKRMSKASKDDYKITDDDFDFEVPSEGTHRVEYTK